MDVLSRLLMLNVPQGTIDKKCLPDGGWVLPHAAGELSVIRWHAVIQGIAELEIPAGQTFILQPGKVALLPQNPAHRLAHSGNEPTYIVCGSLSLPRTARYFLTALPEILFLAPEVNTPEFHWVKMAVSFLQQESGAAMPGADALCSQVSVTIFTLAVREWIAKADPGKNILNLLLHPRLGSVVLHMMEMPGYPWTVESLAGLAHISRAHFAKLFRDVSGTTPQAVLTRLRMQIAAQVFSRGIRPVAEIAESVGYASESSFHKAFVREFRCTPGEYRDRAKELQKNAAQEG